VTPDTGDDRGGRSVPAPAVAPPGCRHCGKPLDAAARLWGRGHCRSAPCLHREAQAREARLRAMLSTSAPADAAAQLPRLRQPPTAVVWLKHCEPEMVTTSADDIAAHRAYLDTVVAQEIEIDRTRLAPSTADDSHVQGQRLCAQCRGRCCVHGAEWHAFIDVTLLRQWQAAHEGASLADAAQAYQDLLPARHVEGACLYQGPRGCVMPRDQRAWICNGYACEPLEQTQRLAAADPQAAVVALTFAHHLIERAAVIDADGIHAFEPGLPDLPPA
jgi:hypothetical protein